jgi:hypothetical protein
MYVCVCVCMYSLSEDAKDFVLKCFFRELAMRPVCMYVCVCVCVCI